MDDFFIYTEAYNCGLIVKKCLETLHNYHNEKVVIFGTEEDFKHITPHNNNILIDISDHIDIINGFNNGHRGTATILAKIINNTFTDKTKIIHFDSDTIFTGECILELKNRLLNGFDLVGPYRCYKNNLNGRKDLDNLTDVVQTYIFGFDKNKITKRSLEELVPMCQGLKNPYGHPILDFFDPISFDILYNGGKVYFLDFNDYGGMDETGNKHNIYGEINVKIDFGSKLIHFAGVGSGMNFYNNNNNNTHEGYKTWAKSQYIIYQKLFYNENFVGEYDHEKYLVIKNIIKQ